MIVMILALNVQIRLVVMLVLNASARMLGSPYLSPHVKSQC
jgi:hypothetical protein